MTVHRRPSYGEFSSPRRGAPYNRSRPDRRPGSSVGLLLQRLTAAMLALSFAVFLLFCGLSSITTASTAGRIIARGLPTLLQTNALLSLHLSDVKAQDPPGKTVSLPGFPVNAGWSPVEIQKLSPQTLAALIDERAAAVIYKEGPAAFSVNGGHSVAVTGPLLSGPWTLHEALFLFNARTHAHLTMLALAAAALVVVLVAALWLQVEGYGRLVGVGIAGLAGAVLAGAAALFLWLLVQLYSSGSGSPLSMAAWGMAADGLWVMILVDAVAALGSGAVCATGVIFASLERRDSQRGRPLPLSFERVARRRRI